MVCNTKSLKSITLSDSITKIGTRAFANCDSLEKITLPAGFNTLENSLFSQCLKLKEVELSNDITDIKSDAFYYCEKLETIRFNGTSEEWEQISKDSYWDEETGDYVVICTDKTLDS